MSHIGNQELWQTLDKHRFCGRFDSVGNAETVYCSIEDFSDIKEYINVEKMVVEQHIREHNRMEEQQQFPQELLEIMKDFSTNPLSTEFPIVFKINGKLFLPKTDTEIQRGELITPSGIPDSDIFVEVPRPTMANMHYMSTVQ